jgi:hypothetical protein
MIRRNHDVKPLPPINEEPKFKRYKLPKSIDENVKKNNLSKMYDYFYFDEEEHKWKSVD